VSSDKRSTLTAVDALFALGLLGLFVPFLLLAEALALYKGMTLQHPLATSFLKFALLGTAGEVLGLRIRAGRYALAGFGLLPRAVVWGALGVSIYFAFAIFSVGAPASLRAIGVPLAPDVLSGPLGWPRLLAALWVSVSLNLFYAPVLMAAHRVTDEHILRGGGRLGALLAPIPVGKILAALDWSVLWGFVFKKTIPLFWIPAQTVTFLLPGEYRILVAALLGLVLGVLLAVASLRSRSAVPAAAAEAGQAAEAG